MGKARTARALPGKRFEASETTPAACLALPLKRGAVNFFANVHLMVDGRDVQLKVRPPEVYHSKPTGWCLVAGQGTEVDERLFPVAKK